MWTLLLAPLVAAAAPVELPSGEDPAAWVNALAMAGLEPGPVKDGPGAWLSATTTGWTAEVRDARGRVHRVALTTPVTPADREAAAAVVGSLLRPAAPEIALPVLAPPPRSAEPKPPARPTALPTPERVAIAAAPDPERAPPERVVAVVVEASEPPPRAPEPEPARLVGVVSAEVEPMDGPAIEALGWSPWFAVAPALRMRPGVRSAAALGVWSGLDAPASPARVGIGVSAAAPALLRLTEEPHRISAIDVRALGAWAPGPWDLGLVVGTSARIQPDGLPAVVLVPTSGVLLARTVELGRVDLRAGGLFDWDWARTPVVEATAGGESLRTSSPAQWCAELSVGVALRAPSRETPADAVR